MKKEVILVPKDKCPLDVLAEMEKRTEKSWIFLHENAFKKLKKTCDRSYTANFHRDNALVWNATAEYPETEIIVQPDVATVWLLVRIIKASDITFTSWAEDPEDIYFLKMDE